jgi:hypothetical protein
VLLTLIAVLSNAHSQQEITVRDRTNEQFHKELTELTLAMRDLAVSAEKLSLSDPMLMSMASSSLLMTKYMSYEDIAAVANTPASLSRLSQEMRDLTRMLDELLQDNQFNPMIGSTPIPAPQGSVSRTCPDAGGDYSDGPPAGPCAQDGLSDATYPWSCPFSTPPRVIIAGRVVATSANAALKLFDISCTFLAFGTNAETACAVIAIGTSFAQQVFDLLDNCNSKRDGPQIRTGYRRAGELFVKNKRFGELQERMGATRSDIWTATRQDQQDTLAFSFNEERDETLAVVDEKVTGSTGRITDLETQTINHANNYLNNILISQKQIMNLLGIPLCYGDPNTTRSGSCPGLTTGSSSTLSSFEKPTTDKLSVSPPRSIFSIKETNRSSDEVFE